MQRTIKIIVVSLSGLLWANFSQAQTMKTGPSLTVQPGIYAKLMQPPADSTLRNPAGNQTLLPADYYTQHLAFFCDKELKLEKKTGIPLRLRLGSLESCNRLEGKR